MWDCCELWDKIFAIGQKKNKLTIVRTIYRSTRSTYATIYHMRTEYLCIRNCTMYNCNNAPRTSDLMRFDGFPSHPFIHACSYHFYICTEGLNWRDLSTIRILRTCTSSRLTKLPVGFGVGRPRDLPSTLPAGIFGKFPRLPTDFKWILSTCQLWSTVSFFMHTLQLQLH